MSRSAGQLADRMINGSSAAKDAEPGGMPTLQEIRESWPATVNVPRAGRAFGLTRSHSYALVASGDFPARVLRVGGRIRVVTASIVKALSEDP